MKVVKPLVDHGYLRSVRGRAGGLALALPAERINLGAVVRLTEENFAPVDCMRDGGHCPIECCCRLMGVMQEALAAFMAVLDRYSLRELIEPGAPLQRILLATGRSHQHLQTV